MKPWHHDRVGLNSLLRHLPESQRTFNRSEGGTFGESVKLGASSLLSQVLSSPPRQQGPRAGNRGGLTGVESENPYGDLCSGWRLFSEKMSTIGDCWSGATDRLGGLAPDPCWRGGLGFCDVTDAPRDLQALLYLSAKINAYITITIPSSA